MTTHDYIGHLTRHIWHYSHCICVITQMAHTSVSTYRSMMTSQQVCKSSHLAHAWHHTQSTSHLIHTIWHEWSCFMTSHTWHSWHQISSLWHHIYSLGHNTTLCMTSCPLPLTSYPLYLCHHTHPIDDITTTTWKVLHPVYLWHHIPYVFDKISTKCDITTLCFVVTTLAYVWHPLHCRWHSIHSITQTTIFMISHALQASHHTLCIRYCTHCNFVITSSPMISHPLLNDITPTLCVTSYAL